MRPPAFLTSQVWPYRPGNVPIKVARQIKAAYGMLRAELNNKIVVAAKVVNRVQYIPVAA